MSSDLRQTLNNQAINKWRLFWLISGPISIAMLIAMMRADLTSGPGISSMIQISVRCAVPLLYIVFAASSLQRLFPGPLSQWLLRNRKYVGLSFAGAMAWQGLFILWMVTVHGEYYVNEVYVLRDAIEGTVGYMFLAAMAVTSFRPTRKHMKPKTWRLLHLSGIYFLWAYAFSVYWWNMFYYGSPVPLDYIYYVGGFLAWSARTAAWAKKRQGSEQLLAKLFGWLLIVFGLAPAVFGSLWQKQSEELLTGYAFTRIPELYLPYWPFEPFLPLFIIALGAYLATRRKV